MPRVSPRLFLVLLLSVILLGGVSLSAYRHHKKYRHFAVHEPGKVYRSAWLEPDALQEVISRHHIRTVVNLCDLTEMGAERHREERLAVERAGARLLEIPMPTTTQPVDHRFSRHYEVLLNPANYPLLVHCQHGVKRTAKFLAMYDIVVRGRSAEESLRAQPLFGRDHHPAHVWELARRLERKVRSGKTPPSHRPVLTVNRRPAFIEIQ